MDGKKISLRQQFKKVLKDNMITQAELARKSGVPKQVISDWLSHDTPKTLIRLKQISDVLGVSIDELCFGKTEVKSNNSTKILEGRIKIIVEKEIVE